MGGQELKWRQLKHNQLMSPQGPHFSPHSTAKTNDKSTNRHLLVYETKARKVMVDFKFDALNR